MLSFLILLGLEVALGYAWHLLLLAFIFTVSGDYGLKLFAIFVLKEVVTFLANYKSKRLVKEIKKGNL